jgi:iron complex outermembrane recepter protein
MTTNQRSYAKIAAVLMSTCAYTALAQAQTFAPSVPAAAPQQVAQAQSATPDQVAQARPAPQQQQAVIEEIIVEGQRIKETALSNVAVDFARYGTQVQVISNYEIDTGGFTNFGELASGLIRGANIGYSPDEGEFTIRIDGGSDRDTLLLLDGVPTFDRGTPLEDLWGATAIDPRMIDSVEIFRGGQSLYYGGNGGLGVVSVRYKQPDGSEKGEFGTYFGAWKTREVYGNKSFKLDSEGNHSVMFYGRSYETDAHEIFDESAYNDTVLELGGKHEFPYSYNLVGAKYLWKLAPGTDFRLGMETATIDFRDSFPNDHIFNPNYTDYPKVLGSLTSEITDRLNVEVEAYFSKPKLKNTEVDAQICRIPQSVLNPATGRPFTRASEYEAFAAARGLPIGCITNPDLSTKADRVSRTGFYVDANGQVKGTLQNPFRIGDPMGFVVQTVANFGTGVPVKGFGDGTQFSAGFIDYGANARAKYKWTDYLETVVGIQRTTSQDDSDPVYGVSDKKLNQTGVYGDMRFDLPFLAGTNISLAARRDFNNQFDNNFIWKYSIRQEFDGGFYVRSSGGTSYNNPRAQEVGFFANTVSNPSLKTQDVETYGVGAGVNGEFGGGTFNVELGYFDTVISNLFGNAQIRDVCPGVDPSRVINPNIITPVEFCSNFRNFGLTPLSTATFNTLAEQDIKGYSFDFSVDLDQITVDLSFTKQDSLEPNPLFGLTAVRAGTGQALTTVVPGRAGSERFRQSGERPEWLASALITYEPTDRIILSVNPKFQGKEWLYVQNNAARLVDAAGNRTNPDVNFGNYAVVNASVQYFHGDDKEHRFMLRVVNLFDKKYSERGGATDRAFARAAIRGDLGVNDSNYYYTYQWNGKPLSFYLQYEYNF